MDTTGRESKNLQSSLFKPAKLTTDPEVSQGNLPATFNLHGSNHRLGDNVADPALKDANLETLSQTCLEILNLQPTQT